MLTVGCSEELIWRISLSTCFIPGFERVSYSVAFDKDPLGFESLFFDILVVGIESKLGGFTLSLPFATVKHFNLPFLIVFVKAAEE